MAYYNYDKINSYNATFNFILSNRGYGKTYGCKLTRCIKRFLKYGEEFAYVRRYKTEFKKVHKFFDDVKEEFPDHKFKVDGYTFYIDGKICGYAIPLSVSLSEKSTPYPLVQTILFDEFIVDKGYIRYMPNEVETFLELYSTIARKRKNVKVYFLANNISSVNPYFKYFDLKPKKDERFTLAKQGRIIVDISENEEFIQEMEDTDFGIIVKGTRYGDYAISNKALRDSNTFIEKISRRDCTPLFNIFYRGEYIQIWINTKNYLYYCDNKRIENTETYSLNMQDHEDNSILNSKSINSNHIQSLIKQFQLCNVRFDNQNVKQNCYDIFKTLGVR